MLLQEFDKGIDPQRANSELGHDIVTTPTMDVLFSVHRPAFGTLTRLEHTPTEKSTQLTLESPTEIADLNSKTSIKFLTGITVTRALKG